MTDIFESTPTTAKRKPGVAGVRKTKRMGQTLRRILLLIDNPDTPLAEKIELVKMADRLARK